MCFFQSPLFSCFLTKVFEFYLFFVPHKEMPEHKHVRRKRKNNNILFFFTKINF
jgi:hypothetical protein